MKAHLYKHIMEDVDALIDPESFEVLGEATPRLMELLSHTSMKELVTMGVFELHSSVDVIADIEVF